MASLKCIYSKAEIFDLANLGQLYTKNYYLLFYFSVRPPRKSWKKISNLSGGEKTLSSLALVFALHYYKPSPLYVMDEIDAALDFKNVSIVGHYIKVSMSFSITISTGTPYTVTICHSNLFNIGCLDSKAIK